MCKREENSSCKKLCSKFCDQIFIPEDGNDNLNFQGRRRDKKNHSEILLFNWLFLTQVSLLTFQHFHTQKHPPIHLLKRCFRYQRFKEGQIVGTYIQHSPPSFAFIHHLYSAAHIFIKLSQPFWVPQNSLQFTSLPSLASFILLTFWSQKQSYLLVIIHYLLPSTFFTCIHSFVLKCTYFHQTFPMKKMEQICYRVIHFQQQKNWRMKK